MLSKACVLIAGRNLYRELRIRLFYLNSRKAWATGYREYKFKAIMDTLNNPDMMRLFRSSLPLPTKFGVGLDERIVEYPWVLSRVDEAQFILDAGSVLNVREILAHPSLLGKSLVIYTLAPEGTISSPHVSYIYGDLRATILKSGQFDLVVCISTLEHIGMDNTMLYTSDKQYQENRDSDYLVVIDELKRLLAPNGKLLITVPYGRAQKLGWMQQFDRAGIRAIEKRLGHLNRTDFYKYTLDGWNISTQDACDDAIYYNIHADRSPQADKAAAARAVACLEYINSTD